MLEWDRYGFNKMRTRIRYSELVFFNPMGSVGHVVHSITFAVRNINALFCKLRWDKYRFDKKALGHITMNLCFCIWWDLQVT
jgi:hypothetical protein